MSSEASPLPSPSKPAAPLIGPGQTFASVTDTISAIALARRTSRGWLAGFGLAFSLLIVLLYAIGYLLVAGVGIWGVNIPAAWGFAIVNFVWWIGIGHAGTLISACLLIFRQEWRRSISRFAETMTLFAIACAGLFPLLHLGRPWYFYWLLPYPNTMDLWPQFRSALVWDIFAVLVYLLVSLMFWYIGLIPDLATLRDQARNRTAARLYGVLALGWRGDVEHWRRHDAAYLLLAALATALVVSVHSVVAFDFAVTVLPGWHTTILPPYFVVGAMHSGFAMVLLLIVPLRRLYRLEAFITERHLQNLAKLLLAISLMLGYSYLVETFSQWHAGKIEWDIALVRMAGPFAIPYWLMLVCNVAAPQIFWFRRARSSPIVLWSVGLVVLIGMWLERYVIVLSSLRRDFLPSSWGPYTGTIWDWATFIGTFGLFFVLLFAFLRLLPLISMSETRELASERESGPHPAEEQKTKTTSGGPGMYGMLAEFDRSDELAAAIRRARQAGYRKLEAFSPVPARNLSEALGRSRNWLPVIVLLGGGLGAGLGYFLQYYLNAINYPINVGGRPLNSWPAFVVITFEMSVLLASLAAVLGMLVLNGLPRLHHPVFNVPRFSLASRDRFFLCLRADDVHFIPEEETRRFLDDLHPLGVWEVPR